MSSMSVYLANWSGPSASCGLWFISTAVPLESNGDVHCRISQSFKMYLILVMALCSLIHGHGQRWLQQNILFAQQIIYDG